MVRDVLASSLMQLSCRWTLILLLSSLSFSNMRQGIALAEPHIGLSGLDLTGLRASTVAHPPHSHLRCRQRATNHRSDAQTEIWQGEMANPDLFAAHVATGRLLAERAAHGPISLTRGHPTAT